MKDHPNLRDQKHTSLLLLVLAAAIPACGGSDDNTGSGQPDAAPAGGSDAATATDAGPDGTPDATLDAALGAAPAVEVQFPPPLSRTDAFTLTVRGTAEDDGDIAAIRVNGVAAQSDTGFASWQASVPLQPGSNPIVVESEDQNGNVDAQAAELTVVQALPLVDPFSMALDAAGGRLFVVDTEELRIVSVDLATGIPSPVRGGELDSHPEQKPTNAITFDPARGRIVFVQNDPEDDRVFTLDPATGERTLVASDTVGAGPDLFQVNAIALDDTGNIAYLTDSDFSNDALIALDLRTGDRTVVSDATTGTGTAFASPQGLALRPASGLDPGHALVVDQTLDALILVNLDSGDRTVVSNASRGSGPAFSVPKGLAVDPTGIAYVSDTGLRAVLRVDLLTGNRTIVADADTGTGAALGAPIALLRDPANDRLLVFGNDTLVTIDLATGDREAIDYSGIGTGETMLAARTLVFDEPTGRALVLNDFGPQIGTVDLWSADAAGQRGLLSSDDAGTGPALIAPDDLAIDRARDRLLVPDRSAGTLVAVDLATGARSILSDAGASPAWTAPQGVAWDETNDRAVVLAADALYTVDSSTGARALVSSADAGSGPLIASASRVVVTPDGQRALLVIDEFDIMDVDLETGNRVMLTGTGQWPNFGPLMALAMDSARERLLVVDQSDDDSGVSKIRSLSVTDGAGTTVASNQDGVGPRIGDGVAVAADTGRNLILFADRQGSNRLFVVDPITQERVVVAN